MVEHPLNFLFPPVCGVCQSSDISGEWKNLCGACHRSMKPGESAHCSVCGKSAETDVSSLDRTSFICGDCRLSRPHFDQAFSFQPYQEPLSQFIRRYKYQRQYWLWDDLLSLCRNRLTEVLDQTRPQWIIPVPLHKQKLKERQFDQSFLLARGISKDFGVPLADEFLIRTRYTRQQTRLNPKDRFQNVRGAFEILNRNGFPKKSRILLVDDVMTTGATARECSRIIKRAGAKHVFVFTVARV